MKYLLLIFILFTCCNSINEPSPIKLTTEKMIIGDWTRKIVIIDSVEIEHPDRFVVRFRDDRIVTYENKFSVFIDTWKPLADSTEFGIIKLNNQQLLLRIDLINEYTVRWYFIQNNKRWFEIYEKIN